MTSEPAKSGPSVAPDYQFMVALEERKVSLTGKAGSSEVIEVPTVCADEFGRLPPPSTFSLPLGDLESFSSTVSLEVTDSPGPRPSDTSQVVRQGDMGPYPPFHGASEGVGPPGGQPTEPQPGPDAAPDLSPSGPQPGYLLSPTLSPYTAVFDAVDSLRAELAALARQGGMLEAMFLAAVMQYSIWKLAGEGTGRPFTWQSVFDLLVRTLQAAGKDASEKEVSEATNALWTGVESVTAKVVQPASGQTPVPVGPRTTIVDHLAIFIDTLTVTAPIREDQALLDPGPGPWPRGTVLRHDTADATAPEKRATVADAIDGVIITFPDGTRVVSNRLGGGEVVYDPEGNVIGGRGDGKDGGATRPDGTPRDTWQPPLDDPQWLEFVEKVAEQAWEMVKRFEDSAEFERNQAKEARQRGDEEEARLHEARARAAEAGAEERRIIAEREQRRADEVRQRQRGA